MIVRLLSGGIEGVDAYPVELEVDYTRQGLPAFSLVGLAETAVREARERVFSALRAAAFRLPPARVTVNLAPAGRRKNGTAYDLPLAMGLLAAAGLLPSDAVGEYLMAGEVSLSGEFWRGSGACAVSSCRRAMRRKRPLSGGCPCLLRPGWRSVPPFWPGR